MSKKHASHAALKINDAYFTISEIAKRLKISDRQVRRIIDRGDLSATHFGRSVRISLGELLAFEHKARAVR